MLYNCGLFIVKFLMTLLFNFTFTLIGLFDNDSATKFIILPFVNIVKEELFLVDCKCSSF